MTCVVSLIGLYLIQKEVLVMGAYVDANGSLVQSLSQENEDLEFRYTRVMAEGRTSHRVIIGRIMHKCEAFYPERFEVLSTYGFPTAKEANAFLNGLIVMNDYNNHCPVNVEEDPHYVMTF